MSDRKQRPCAWPWSMIFRRHKNGHFGDSIPTECKEHKSFNGRGTIPGSRESMDWKTGQQKHETKRYLGDDKHSVVGKLPCRAGKVLPVPAANYGWRSQQRSWGWSHAAGSIAMETGAVRGRGQKLLHNRQTTLADTSGISAKKGAGRTFTLPGPSGGVGILR